MEGFLSFVLFGGLFLLMMRYGCGAHVMHDSHTPGKASTAEEKDNVDPVCGMTVTHDVGGYTKMHEGQLFRFCSRKCLDKFDSAPSDYLVSKSSAEHK